MTSLWLWIGFLLIVGIVLALDLGVLNRRSRVISPARALLNTGVFVMMALAFTVVIYTIYDRGWMGEAFAKSGAPMTGAAAATEYLTTWLLEYALSVDNLFVFTLIFAHFKVPQQHQHRVLFWGILGALILRGVMIGAGTALVERFAWLLIAFGLLLLWTAFKMLFGKEGQFDPGKSVMLRLARVFFPVVPELHEERFFVRGTPAELRLTDRTGTVAVLAATPLFLVLLIVEGTDVMFALDSIPAAFAQTREPFIIFTSNVFAIMGLRSLYFALASLIRAFTYLKVSLALILAFIGVKMIIEFPIEELRLFGLIEWLGWKPIHLGFKGVHIDSTVSLGVIATALAMGVLVSLLPKREPRAVVGTQPSATDAPPPDSGKA